MAIVFFTGCATASTTIDVSKQTPDESESPVLSQSNTTVSTSSKLLPNESISVHSIEELEKMQEMLSCDDEKELENYLIGIEGGGAHSKEDLSKFLSLVEGIPYLPLIEGDIVWISYSTGQSQDTGENVEVLCVSTKASSGDWCRIEYNLLVNDIEDEISKRREKGEFEGSTITDTVSFPRNDVNIYSEVVKDHPSGVGKTVNWTIDVKGVFAYAVYYVQGETPDTDLFHSVQSTSISFEK